MEENKEAQLPEAKNPISAEEAEKVIALVSLDMAKFEVEKARGAAIAANADVLIAQSKLTIADLRRRVANVDYPPEPEKPAEEGK